MNYGEAALGRAGNATHLACSAMQIREDPQMIIGRMTCSSFA